MKAKAEGDIGWEGSGEREREGGEGEGKKEDFQIKRKEQSECSANVNMYTMTSDVTIWKLRGGQVYDTWNPFP